MPASDFAQEEEKILEEWNKKNILKLIDEKNAPQGEFVFFEGPPTANARPALHHVLARVFKDVILRYKTMRGYHIDRKAGWDTHGLPVEIQVEKKLGISGKPQIENIIEGDVAASIKKFNAECKDMVWGFLDEWQKLTNRIGYALDMEHPYITYENQYIESVWWVFKQMWDKGLVYESHKVVPYCTRCGTALSSHEVAQGYETVKDRSVYIKFKVVGENNTYVLSWTTTPWTLPGNVALAVGKDIEYVYARVGEEVLIMAKNRLQILDGEYEIMKEMRGSDLVGLAYEPLFEVSSLKSDASYKIYVADFVTDSDGTGVVHTAVMYGVDDYGLGVEAGLPRVHTVDEAGLFVDEVGAGLSGKYVKDPKTEQLIIDYLNERGSLLGEEKYEHEYPFCWRCKTALLYYARDSWFIRVTDVKDRLVENNQTIHWEPEHIRDGRFGEWLNNIHDWAISRERYWGTPLPIWECESCEEAICVSSLRELGVENEVELHRPYIDEVKVACKKCGGSMKRVSAVMDVWFDSGAMPIAQWGFPRVDGSDEELNEHFPADYICEAIDQTRGWFYTLLSIATLLEREAPYKNVICLGHILDSKGNKMSKSKGNVVDPWEVINTHGVDALRWHLFTMSAAGEPKRFDMKGVDQAKRRTIMILWNIVQFYLLYKKPTVENRDLLAFHSHLLSSYVEYGSFDARSNASHLIDFERSETVDGKRESTSSAELLLDQWVLARLHETIREVSAQLDAYDVTRAGRALHDFIDDVSVWYVRRSRSRFKQNESGVVDVLQYVLLEISKLAAPFMPFIAERVYRAVDGESASAHLDDWPIADERLINSGVLQNMKHARAVVELGLRLRAEAGIKVRQPLSILAVEGVKFDAGYVEIIQDELNVKQIIMEKKEGDGWVCASEGNLSVALYTVVDEALKREGVAREVVRTVNNLRKNAGLSIGDRIVLMVQVGESARAVFEEHGAYIKESTLSDEVRFEIDGEGELLESECGEIRLKVSVV